MLGSIGRQKFTKALILSGGASVIEVDVGHAARQGASRYSPLRLTRLALHVLAGFWPQPIQWAGVVLGFVCTLAATALGIYGVVYWIGEVELPRAALPRRRRDLRARRPGLRARARRRVPRAGSSARSRAGRCTRSSASCSSRPRRYHRGAVKRVLVTGGAGFISSNVDPPPAGAARRTRSSRSTRSPTPATSRTSPT